MGAGGETGGSAVRQEGADEPGDSGEEADAKHPPVQIAMAAFLAISLQKEGSQGHLTDCRSTMHP